MTFKKNSFKNIPFTYKTLFTLYNLCLNEINDDNAQFDITVIYLFTKLILFIYLTKPNAVI